MPDKTMRLDLDRRVNVKHAYLRHDDEKGFVLCKIMTSEIISQVSVGDGEEVDWDLVGAQSKELGYEFVGGDDRPARNATTNYRNRIYMALNRYALAGEELNRSILEGSPDIIDRKAAIEIAEWLRDEADGEWGEDARHQAIASEILTLVEED